ncbi:MAG: DUF4886 domain-containing protein [Bacteroidaceae bacterium]|jgi:hypothetical protein|nr:DUF4886 domain-containing protein [Bacteroidaceae bacterium]
MSWFKRSVTVLLATFLICCSCMSAGRVLKVLAIGNSFSEDAVEQNLYELAAKQGDSLVIGNAYIGGCSIDHHWENAQTGREEYSYRKITGGQLITRNHVSLKEIIQDDKWDVITLQQASHFSGIPDTYNNLGKLMNYVKCTALNKHFRFAFHQTWAYAETSKHDAFKWYGNDQKKMYHDICKTVREVTSHFGIHKIIPSGIAIQNARTLVGDTLNRDGYHLSYLMGRYTAACTWCEFLTGKNVMKNSYRPQALNLAAAEIARKSAHLAIKNVKKELRKAR